MRLVITRSLVVRLGFTFSSALFALGNSALQILFGGLHRLNANPDNRLQEDQAAPDHSSGGIGHGFEMCSTKSPVRLNPTDDHGFVSRLKHTLRMSRAW